MRIGEQTPAFDTGPAGITSAGPECVELAASAGLHLDPWQRYVLNQGLQERADGKWSALEVAVLVSRQNGKGSIITARQLGGLFLFGSRLSLYSAHEFKTSTEMFLRLKELITNSDDLRRRVKKVTEAHGEEGIELLNGNRLRFVARSRGSGRGFSGDDIYLDEAMFLYARMVGAMMPTMSARPNPQIWYLGSAPLLDSDMLHKVRRRGRDGKAKRLRYMEWCAHDPKTPLDSIDALYQANPAMGIRLTEEFAESEREAMDPVEYARERLGIVEEDQAGGSVVNMAVWDELEDQASRRSGPIVISADITPERSYGAISWAGRRDDGLWHVEVHQHRRGTGWMAVEALRLLRRPDVRGIVLDEKSPAATLIPEMRDLIRAQKIPDYQIRGELDRLDSMTITTGVQDLATACALFYDAVLLEEDKNPTLRHIGQADLTVALAGADTRTLGSAGSWAWDRKSPAVDITPLVSVTLALWGRIVHGDRQEEDMEPFVMML